MRRRTPGRYADGQGDLPVNAIFANGFRRILDQIQEDLDQLVARAEDVRQRRIVDFQKPDVAREAGLGEPFHMVEHGVDIEAFPLRRRRIGEGLHPVDQLNDPVGLVADETGQRAVLVAGARLEQLSRATDARQRVFDLVGEHGPERSD